MVRNSLLFVCLFVRGQSSFRLFVLLITIIDEYCIDRTGPSQRPDIQVQTGACPWLVSEDGVDMPERGAFDASAWHSSRPFCAPFSTSSSDFGTRF